MQNFIADGASLQIAAPTGGVTGGGTVLMSSLVGIAAATAAEGDQVTVMVRGIYKVAKATGAGWAVGDKLYWDATNSVFTKTASGNTLAGYASAVAVSGDATGNILLAQ